MNDLPKLPEPAAFRWCEFGEYRYSTMPPMHVPPVLTRLCTEAALLAHREEYAQALVLRERERTNEAFKMGWINAARWANREDMIADTDSEAYARERDALIAAESRKG